MDRISELKPDFDYEELYRKEKYKTKVLEAENGRLKSQVNFLKEELGLITVSIADYLKAGNYVIIGNKQLSWGSSSGSYCIYIDTKPQHDFKAFSDINSALIELFRK